jgi:signal transduction histidine kinase
MTSTPIAHPSGGLDQQLGGVARARTAVTNGATAVRRILARPDGPLAAALVLAGASLIEASIYRDGSHREVAILLGLCATLPLGLAPRRLVWAALIVTPTTIIVVSQPDPLFTVSGIVGQLAVAYLVARRYPRWVSAALALPFAINAIIPFTGDDDLSGGIVLLVLVVGALVLGDAQRQSGRAIAERDATRLAMAETLRDQAVLEERARIAHELHDVVAHHISMIAVQADTARLATADMPDEGRERLAAIGDTARGALDEMRRLLGVLGDGDGPASERVPQPGLQRLDDLIEAARSAGTDVRLVLQGPSGPLLPSVDLTAYRIVQESLTNARRHAPGTAVTVEVRYGDDTLHVRVRDDGPGPASGAAGPAGSRGGHGLVGMAERAALVGGRFRAGPGGGGFVVEADLPVGRGDRPGDR